MTTTDHRTVAEDMLTSAGAAEPGSVDERYYVAAAHAHATLYLADEARETNRRAERDMQVRHEMAKQAFEYEAARSFR